MKISRKHFYQISIIVVVVVAGLSIGFLVWRHWANQNALIGKDQAIQNAIRACPYIGLQQVEQPTEFQAELTTWRRADGHGFARDPKSPVWVVEMKGRWMLMGGPQPAPDSNPEPFYWNECTIIIDARTGESLTIPIQ